MQQDNQQVICLRGDQQRPAAEVLARAFFEDPLMVYYLPDRKRREKILPSLMLASLRYCLFYGEVITTRGFDGLACWLPPGQTKLNTLGLIRAGIGIVSPFLGVEAFWRVNQVEPAVDRIHRACMPEPHWYLMVLGVEPELQGQGIGGRLIDARLVEAKASGLPCYLETMTEKNVRFYRGHGFEVVFETELPPGGIRTWMMAKR